MNYAELAGKAALALAGATIVAAVIVGITKAKRWRWLAIPAMVTIALWFLTYVLG